MARLPRKHRWLLGLAAACALFLGLYLFTQPRPVTPGSNLSKAFDGVAESKRSLITSTASTTDTRSDLGISGVEAKGMLEASLDNLKRATAYVKKSRWTTPKGTEVIATERILKTDDGLFKRMDYEARRGHLKPLLYTTLQTPEGLYHFARGQILYLPRDKLETESERISQLALDVVSQPEIADLLTSGSDGLQYSYQAKKLSGSGNLVEVTASLPPKSGLVDKALRKALSTQQPMDKNAGERIYLINTESNQIESVRENNRTGTMTQLYNFAPTAEELSASMFDPPEKSKLLVMGSAAELRDQKARTMFPKFHFPSDKR